MKTFQFGNYAALATIKEDNKVYVEYEYVKDGNKIETYSPNTDMDIVLGMVRNWCIENGLILWSY
ncbi:hypothetical protein [Mucilaginibacter sp. UYCu711]|uniref:hypothetical protein n=1 Tax=Mucilaginibacter sp. UYCu711 TaxID=3156339 RepID=UPI003D224316